MNKARIDRDLRAAYQALDNCGIVEEINGRKEVDFSFRGQIASFGASVSMGSLLSAIAFFSAQNSAEVARDKLMNAILFILKSDGRAAEDCQSLYAYAAERTDGKAGGYSECGDCPETGDEPVSPEGYGEETG